ncbi:MAG: C45 family peptidase [Planctomycetota bacterium]
MNRRLLLVCACICLFFSSAAGSDKEAVVFRPQSEGDCTLVYEQGIPILTLCGSPETMGHAQGHFMKDQVEAMYQQFMKPASNMAGGMPNLQASAMKMEKQIPERFRQELKALSEASGQAYELLITANAFPDVYRNGGCSTLAVMGSASKEGNPLLARNLDFFTLTVLETYGIVIVYKPEGYNAFVSVTWPSLTGVLSGMNEKGLCCAVMEVRTGKRSNEGMPSTFLFRKVMEEAGSVEEGLWILKNAQSVASNNLMLIDVSGAATVAELGPGYFEVRQPEEGVLYSTNHHRHAPNLLHPCARFDRLNAFTKKHHGELDLSLLKKALDEVNQGGITVQSMVFEPVELGLHLSMGVLPATRGTYSALSFKGKLCKSLMPSKAGIREKEKTDSQ